MTLKNLIGWLFLAALITAWYVTFRWLNGSLNTAPGFTNPLALWDPLYGPEKVDAREGLAFAISLGVWALIGKLIGKCKTLAYLTS